MAGLTLVFNAGSSSLKFALFDGAAPVAKGQLEWPDGQALPDLKPALKQAGISTEDVTAIGQRVVHGGTSFRETVWIDDRVKTEIERWSEMAPLHNPRALDAIRGADRAFPGIRQAAAFDTAYFHDLPPSQYLYPVPYEWFERWGIRRFGFHGLSHGDCARRAGEWLKRSDARVISCHLGQGCSVTASRGTSAVATSMGFTPLEGLMMGSRAGSIDPGLLLFVERRHGLSPETLEKTLNHDSGVKAISGVSNDYRKVVEAARAGHERARLALEMFCDRVRATIGAMAVTLGGVDALVFTGGVGEHAADLRAQIAEQLDVLGIRLDAGRNLAAKPDAEISPSGSAVRVFVLAADEERVISEQIARLPR